MKKHYLLMLAAAASFTFVSCDKDKDEVKLTKTDMLTAKTWSLTERSEVTTDASGTATDNSLDACEKDDTYKFTADNKVAFDEGATKCDSTAAQTSTGNWAFSENDTKLTLITSGISIPADVIELSSNKMVLKTTFDFAGTSVVTTNTFTGK